MPRSTAKAFPQELLGYYDYYTRREISRRGFLNLTAKYAVGGMTALALFDLLKPDYTLTTQVEFADPEVIAEYITYPSPNGHGKVQDYLAKPAKMSGRTPVVVVVHENRGLNPYIEGAIRRVTREGYIALVPDGLSSVGGYPDSDDKGHELQQQVDPTKLINNFFAAIGFIQHYPQVTGKVYISGFYCGGDVSNAAAVAYPELTCAVPFYGRQTPTADVAKIEAPLLLHCAELDSRINKGWPVYEAALKANNKVYETYICPGVNHGSHNNSTPRYDKSAVDPAWQRTLKWSDKYLS